MKRTVPIMWLIGGLLAISATVYLVDFLINPAGLRDTMPYYVLLDLAFLPLNVIIVGLFLNRLIASRERQELIHKMNIVIGAFFTQAGNDLICTLSRFDATLDEDRPHLSFDNSWKANDFEHHRDVVRGEQHEMRFDAGDIEQLKARLEEQRPFILGLLQNGNLLEHDSFSDMLWAVSHLGEELAVRKDLSQLTPPDRRHIELDMSRAFGRLLSEWLLYARHLQAHYPYLYSFAVRTNPFSPDAKVEVEA